MEKATGFLKNIFPREKIDKNLVDYTFVLLFPKIVVKDKHTKKHTEFYNALSPEIKKILNIFEKNNKDTLKVFFQNSGRSIS